MTISILTHVPFITTFNDSFFQPQTSSYVKEYHKYNVASFTI